MNIDFFQEIVGPAFVVTKVIEVADRQYAFYVSKEFHDSGGNDTYALVGHGPLLFDKKTNVVTRLGSEEFFKEHLPLLDSKRTPALTPDISQIKENAQHRKHLNMDEIEHVFNFFGLRFEEVNIYTKDDIDVIFESSNIDYLKVLATFFQSIPLPFKFESDSKLVLINN
ncbi:MAG: hypothetical protein AB8F95_04045 [Bacteroidia bacterium]